MPPRDDLAGTEIYSFECESGGNTPADGRDHRPRAVKDIEHAVFAATAG